MRKNDFEKMQQNLQQMRNNLENIHNMEFTETVHKKPNKKVRRAVEKKINQIEHPNVARIAKEEHMIVMATIAIVAITFIFSTSIFAKTMSENAEEKQFQAEQQVNVSDEEINYEEEQEKNEETKEIEEEKSDEPVVLEKNENAIQLEEILLENVSVLKSKEYAEEERPLAFETKYNENPNLPEGEEIITQEGINGVQQVTVIKSYENNELVSENILEALVKVSYVPQIIDVGTSKFLGNNKVHLGDTMYLTEEAKLMENPKDNANELCVILKSLDVALLELSGEDWCKISYDGIEGYVKCKQLTSSVVTPGVIEANRIQRIKMTLSEDMPLNKSTSLTLEDYQRILSGNIPDRNNVISDNAEAFYNADKNYNMNGVFLASMAIHESAWGTSTIANNKKNLFGYGAYDSSPYASSFTFETYAEGIDLVAKVLVKYYLNEAGTPIYGDEVAKASYYSGPTAAGVNIRYASDTEWHNKVYKYMSYLYNRL